MKFNPFSSLIEITGSRKLGKILLKMGAISTDDLEQALKIKNEIPDKPLSEIIIEKGYSSQKYVNIALDEQRKENRLGQLLVSSGLLTNEKLDDALQDQKNSKQKLGNILIQKGYANETQIKNALKFQRRDNRLGTLLVRDNYINEEQLKEALYFQELKGILLGEALISLGFISTEQLTEALLTQSRKNTGNE